MRRRITRVTSLVAVSAAAQFAAACGDTDAGVRVLGTVAPGVEGAPASGTTSEFSTTGTVDGEVFLDPQGAYTMTISSDWSRMSGVADDDIEFWALDSSQVGFADNVNVLTQDAPDMDLDDYMDISAKNMGGLQVLDQYTVVGTNGNELGVLESQGTPLGAATDTPIHFLTVVDVLDEVAIVATLSATPESFEARRSTAEPYLLTLQAT
jgi:hypothetical protein